jgi:hypothetical protein
MISDFGPPRLPHGLPPVQRRFPTNLLAHSGTESQTTLPQTVSGFRRRVENLTNARFRGRSWGLQHPRCDPGTKRPPTSGCRQSGRYSTAVATGNIPTCWHHCGHISRPAEQHKRIGKQGGWWGSVTHGVEDQFVISMSVHARRSQPPISFSASNHCTELDLCGSSRQRSLGPGGGLRIGRAYTL